MDYNKIKQLLIDKNISVNDISNQLGLTSAGFKRSFESGNLTLNRIEVLCNTLSITPNELFGVDSAGVSVGKIGVCSMCVEKEKRIAVMEKYIRTLESENERLKRKQE